MKPQAQPMLVLGRWSSEPYIVVNDETECASIPGQLEIPGGLARKVVPVFAV